MTQIPAGWYPDPDPSQPEPRGQRYWDGQRWTEHVQQAPAAGTPYQSMTPYAGGYAAPRPTTPDGQPLAGWWQRVGALLIDSLILTPVVVIVGLPWIREIATAYGDYFDEVMRAAERGDSTMPSQTALLTDLVGPFLILTLVGLGINFAYNGGFLKWKAATPGKLALGLRVRLRETPGPLSWGTIVKRWVGQNGYAALSAVPIVSTVAGLYPLVNYLWPLWDDKKQALHDKLAKTNVIRLR